MLELTFGIVENNRGGYLTFIRLASRIRRKDKRANC